MSKPNFIGTGPNNGCGAGIGYIGPRGNIGYKKGSIFQNLSTNSLHERVRGFQSKRQFNQNVVQNFPRQYNTIAESAQNNPKPVGVADSSSRAMIQRIKASGKSTSSQAHTQQTTYGSNSGNLNSINTAKHKVRGSGCTPQKCAINSSGCNPSS